MDLAKYWVNACLVEGPSVRSVALATGRSKSCVHRHLALYRDGGEQALALRRRGPKVPANLTAQDLEDQIVEILGGVQRHHLISDIKVAQVFEPELTPLQLKVLNHVHVPATVYASASASWSGGYFSHKKCRTSSRRFVGGEFR